MIDVIEARAERTAAGSSAATFNPDLATLRALGTALPGPLPVAINGVRVKPALREKTVDQETRKRFAEQHQAVVTAMLARNSELAEQRMREHLSSVQIRVTAREKNRGAAVEPAAAGPSAIESSPAEAKPAAPSRRGRPASSQRDAG